MNNELYVIRQLQSITITLQLINLIKYYKIKKLSKKGVPQNSKNSKLERISSNSPSQLRFAGEHRL